MNDRARGRTPANGKPRSRVSSRVLVRAARVAGACAGGVLLAAACGGIGDPDYVPEERRAVNQADLDNAPFCVRTCAPDYGSQAIDCGVEDGYDFFPVPVFDFNGAVATQLYTYSDETSNFLIPSGYEPPTVEVNDRCGDEPERVLHVRGGPFLEWGGGMGRRLLNFVSAECPFGSRREGDPEYCPGPDARMDALSLDEDGEVIPEFSSARTQFYEMMVNVSEWDGISFWARQGPDSQGGIRVYIGDRQLDEDSAYIETEAGLEPLCGRVRECGCRNHKPCSENDAPVQGLSCWDPEVDTPPSVIRQQYFERDGNYAGFIADFPEIYEPCGRTACNEDNAAFTAPESIFSTPEHPTNPGTAQCLPYKLESDLEDIFCYDPDGPEMFLPADGPQRCGDGWAAGVNLSTDWKFYTVPFAELRQEGWGKMFGYLDLEHVTLVRFTWPQGWIDVWLDDVRFYRTKRPEQLATEDGVQE